MKWCHRCKRRKFFEKGWYINTYTFYCPQCWAEIERIENEEKEKRQNEWNKRLTQIYSNSQKLKDIAEEKVMFSEKFKVEIVQLAKDRFNWIEHDLNKIKKFEEDGTHDDGGSTRHVEDSHMDEVLRFLSNIKDPKNSDEIRIIIHQCLELARTKEVDSSSYVFDYSICSSYEFDCDKFPVSFLLRLAALDHETTVNELCAEVENINEDFFVKECIVFALGKIGDRRATVSLLRIIQIIDPDEDYHIYLECGARALADLKDERAIVPLAKMLYHLCRSTFEAWKLYDYISEQFGSILQPSTAQYEQICTIYKQSKEDEDVNHSHIVIGEMILEKMLMIAGGDTGVEIAIQWAQREAYDDALIGVSALAKHKDDKKAFSVLCQIANTSKDLCVDGGDIDIGRDPRFKSSAEHRITALKSIAQNKDSKVLSVLKKASRDKNPEVREIATQLLQGV
jgi:hypothetical protein